MKEVLTRRQVGNRSSNSVRAVGRESQDGRQADWVSSFAILGDSWTALVASFSVLVIAVLISLNVERNPSLQLLPFRPISSWWSRNQEIDWGKAYRSLGPVPDIDPPKIFLVDTAVDAQEKSLVTQEIMQAYGKDGVVAIRGLIDDELMDALDRDSAALVHSPPQGGGKVNRKKKGTQFHTVHSGALFRAHNASSFIRVALASPVSRVAAELLRSTKEIDGSSSVENLRVMRDILLSKDDDEYICGWHVDDLGFWPATPDAAGVNAWIALDDMPPEHGGGFALAVGSHDAAWRQEAQYITGASTAFPAGGYESVGKYDDTVVAVRFLDDFTARMI